jgi:hypothetical protein
MDTRIVTASNSILAGLAETPEIGPPTSTDSGNRKENAMTAKDSFRTRSVRVGGRLANVVVILAVGVGVSQLASATPIDVAGYSFESPATTGWVPAAADGWQQSGEVAGFQNATTQGWTITDIDGSQTGYVNSYTGPAWLTSANALTTVCEGDYTLTVGVGKRSDTTPMTAYQLDLKYLDGAGVLQTFASTGRVDASGIAAGTMVDQTLRFTVASGNAAIGHGLYIALVNPEPAGDNTQVNFDNVRLDAPIPEPGTVILLVTGAFTLLAYAWRKRK